jgi:hypothetical protein
VIRTFRYCKMQSANLPLFWTKSFSWAELPQACSSTDEAAAPIRGTTDVDVIAEIVTYADYLAFSERLRQAHFTETGLTCRWHNGRFDARCSWP